MLHQAGSVRLDKAGLCSREMASTARFRRSAFPKAITTARTIAISPNPWTRWRRSTSITCLELKPGTTKPALPKLSALLASAEIGNQVRPNCPPSRFPEQLIFRLRALPDASPEVGSDRSYLRPIGAAGALLRSGSASRQEIARIFLGLRCRRGGLL